MVLEARLGNAFSVLHRLLSWDINTNGSLHGVLGKPNLVPRRLSATLGMCCIPRESGESAHRGLAQCEGSEGCLCTGDVKLTPA